MRYGVAIWAIGILGALASAATSAPPWLGIVWGLMVPVGMIAIFIVEEGRS